MHVPSLHLTKRSRTTIAILAAVALALLIFQAGVMAGYHKARFGMGYGDSFHREFIDPHRSDMGKGFFGEGIPGGHGAVGEIISINLPQFVVAGSDNLEKTIRIASTTHIREFQNELPASGLMVGSTVVVLGVPNTNGQIDAKLVRVLPGATTTPTIR